MGAEQVVPSVAVDEVCGFAVDGYVEGFVACHALACLGVELYEAYVAEICAVADPEAACGGVEEQAWVDGIVVFQSVGCCHLDGFGIFELRRLGVERLVPHGQDASVVSAAEASACGSVDDEVAVAYLEHVGCCTSAGAFCS